MGFLQYKGDTVLCWTWYCIVHFAGSSVEERTLEGHKQPSLRPKAAHRDCLLSTNVINQSKIRWAMSTIKLFQSPGTDGIVPALLQQGVDLLMIHLCHIFTACIAREYVRKP